MKANHYIGFFNILFTLSFLLQLGGHFGPHFVFAGFNFYVVYYFNNIVFYLYKDENISISRIPPFLDNWGLISLWNLKINF